MTFITTPPTTPGFYAWRMNEFAMPSPVKITQTVKGLAAHFYSDLPAILRKDFSGEWCRLVPAEEVELAFLEGINVPLMRYDNNTEAWNHSRAKQIAEGKI